MSEVCGGVYKQVMHKLGHPSWRVPFTESIVRKGNKPWMFVGADVCHDKKIRGAFGGGGESGSCVGFTASWESTFTQYHGYKKTQGRFEEYISTSKDLMKQALQDFKKKSNVYPQHILVYRDGVGDSQIEAFVRKEIKQYDLALEELGLANSVKMTIIVVMKRLQERIFQKCPVAARVSRECTVMGRGRCDKKALHTPLPGTVVDTEICSPMYSEFFLVPSTAPPGATATPTKFIIVRDDNNFGSDDIQNLTYQLCWMYSNWTGPIRVPSPVMYAHKIAYLYGKYVNGSPNSAISDKLFYL